MKNPNEKNVYTFSSNNSVRVRDKANESHGGVTPPFDNITHVFLRSSLVRVRLH